MPEHLSQADTPPQRKGRGSPARKRPEDPPLVTHSQQHLSNPRRRAALPGHGPACGRQPHTETQHPAPGGPGRLTFPKNPLLGTDVCLQLGCSNVNPNRLWEVADSLGHHGLGGVPGLQPGCFQPDIFTLGANRKSGMCPCKPEPHGAAAPGTPQPQDTRLAPGTTPIHQGFLKNYVFIDF